MADYWLYTTQSNTAPSNVLSATGTNNANYYNCLHIHQSAIFPDAGGGVCGIAWAVRHV